MFEQIHHPGRLAASDFTVCNSLDQALAALDGDRDFLKAGGVFTDDFIDGYIDVKMAEVTRFRAATHPLEFAMYYAI